MHTIFVFTCDLTSMEIFDSVQKEVHFIVTFLSLFIVSELLFSHLLLHQNTTYLTLGYLVKFWLCLSICLWNKLEELESALIYFYFPFSCWWVKSGGLLLRWHVKEVYTLHLWSLFYLMLWFYFDSSSNILPSLTYISFLNYMGINKFFLLSFTIFLVEAIIDNVPMR